jgi:hypothetical protein
MISSRRRKREGARMQQKLGHDHSPEAIRERLSAAPRASYLRDWIYGGIDGAVTTFAIVAGVAEAHLAGAVVLVLGLANLIADGFAMAAGNYLGVKAEADDYQRLLAVERQHIAVVPEGEREEVRQIFAAKGFIGDDLERAVAVVTADETVWARTMAAEEYGGNTRAEITAARWSDDLLRLSAVRDRPARDLYRRRLERLRGQEPMVDDRLALVRTGDAVDRNGRGDTGFRPRVWLARLAMTPEI